MTQKVDLFDREATTSDWITSNFWIPELRGPLWLAPYQKEFMDTALEKDAESNYCNSLILWSDLKKSAKSSIAAAVALRRAFQLDWGSIKVVASDLKQAQSRSYFYIIRSLRLNPQTKEMLERGEIKVTRYTIDLFFNNTKIEAIPCEPKGEAGGNDDMILFTELWTYMHPTHEVMWSEMQIPPNKYGRAFRWVESYAGYTGESVILERLYDYTVREENRLPDMIAPVYKTENSIAMWNTTPRLPWQTQEYYRDASRQLSPEEFRRVHKNEWVGSVNRFVPEQWWFDCYEDRTRTTGKESVVIGVDAAYASEGDCFAVVVVGKHPTDDDKRAVKEVKVWRAGRGGQLPFKDVKDETNPRYPYGYIADVAKRYNVLEVAYDPDQLKLMALEQNRKRIAFWKEFNQMTGRRVADNELFAAIQNRTISHHDDMTLNEHIRNAGRDSKGRLVKLANERKIDAAVALSMAHSRSRYYRM